MNLTFRKARNAFIFTLGGNVVGIEGLQLREGFQKLVDSKGTGAVVLVDCSSTHIMDSSGLGALVWAHSRIVREGSGRLGLLNIGQSFERLLTRADLLPLFELFTDEDTAVEAMCA